MRSQTFAALGEPSRLRITELLRTGPRSVGEIAGLLDIRQPQVSKHLGVLGDNGLVGREIMARHRIYHLEPEPFDALGHWLSSFAAVWDSRLDSLGAYLESTKTEGSRDG